MPNKAQSRLSRPPSAPRPGPGQESVWDYPRPPAIELVARLVEVRAGDTLIARTTGSYKVMETASPPTYYIPSDDVDLGFLLPVEDRTYCEWKGMASYWALSADPMEPVAWSYERPRPQFHKIRNCLSFYPGRVACYLDGERVQPQPGRFYGGWITAEITGPFKGEPGTGHW